MKIRKNISIIMAGILMSFVSFSSIPVSAADEATVTDAPLTAEVHNDGNFVHLDWSKWKAPKDKAYSYTIHSKRNDEEKSQTIPSKGSETDPIKVLNIFPGSSEKDSKGEDQSNRGNNLKTWMNQPAKYTDPKDSTKELYEKDAAGNILTNSRGIIKADSNGEPCKDDDGNYVYLSPGIIQVDTVRIGNINGTEEGSFNNNPEGYLKSGDEWKYDVVYEGGWDSNNGKDLSLNAESVINAFIDSGRGYLGGHDTFLKNLVNRNQFMDKLNLALKQDSVYGSTEVKINKSGLLTNYPWNIGEVGSTLTVPVSHANQVAYGDIWLKYTSNTYGKATEVSEYEGKPGTNNFYLTTWNNTAMIQTGHANEGATPDEQKILANTLFYLAQVTDNTSWDDHKGQDLAAPDKPGISNAKYDKTNKKIKIDFSKVKDNASTYKYYIEAKEKGKENKLFIPEGADTDELKAVTATVETGLKGYSIVVDQNEDTVPDKETEMEDNIEGTYNTYTADVPYNGDFYVHVAAVDIAGNVSKVETFAYPALELTQGEVENNAVKITAKGNDSVSKIVLPNGEVVNSNNGEFTAKANGEYVFHAYDKYDNEVTKSIKVNSLKTNVILDDIKVNEKSNSLNWSITDDTQIYSYNVNRNESGDKKVTSISVNETSYEDTDAKDVTAPAKSKITDVDINKDSNTTTIKFNASADEGTSYDYNVDAIASESGVKSTSETKSATVISGLKGYSVVIDENPDTKPDGTITTANNEFTFDKAYEGHFYVHVAAVDNAGNISEADTYECDKPVLELSTSTSAVVKDKVVIKADASKSLRKVVKIITPDNKEVDGDKAQYPVDANGEYSFTAIDENGNKTTKTIKVENVIPDVILNIEPTTINKHLNEKFTADLTINNIKDVYATQIRVRYDSSNLEFLGFDQVEGVRLTYDNRADGEITFILLSKNISYPMSGKSTIIKMNFKGIQAGTSVIDIVKASLSDGLLFEKDLRDAECGHATVNICDRELKKEYTLFDVAEIVRHYGDDPALLLEKGIDADLNLDGKIDEADSAMCQEFMLNNPNRKF